MRKTRANPTSATQFYSNHSQQLRAYALAASAAGVGLLALGQPAQAEVVYTPAHVRLEGANALFFLDVNHDGSADYDLVLTNGRDFGLLNVGAFHSNGAPSSNGLEYRRYNVLPIVLGSGTPIGTHDKFFGCGTCSSGADLIFVERGQHDGYWSNVSNRYLGLKFFVGSNTYYGWARLSVKVDGLTVSALLTGYAYESIPNHPIHAGQTSGTFGDPVFGEGTSGAGTETLPEEISREEPRPATLGRLALGAVSAR